MITAPTPTIPHDRGYHHGDLRSALLSSAEAILVERGVEGFTLRECARRAGVSPAAPAHHFGNMTGLLTAIATLGFEGLADAMGAAASLAGPQPRDRLDAIGRAYVDYAFEHPGRFRVIFGRFPLDHTSPALAESSARSYGILADTIAHLGRQARMDAAQEQASLVMAWAIVHGFATLVLDGHMPFLDDGEDAAAAIARLTARLMAMMSAAIGR